MLSLSPALTLTWQISAGEVAYINHQFIEKEHLFIALCKVADLLRPEAFGKMEGLNKNMLKAELETLEGIFVQLNIDRTRLRRRLREMLGKGSYKHTEKAVHRSKECKGYFEKAEERAILYKSLEANIFHLLAVIMEAPGLHIANAFSDLKINAQEIKNAAEGIGKELGEAVHAFAEAVSAFSRKLREGILTHKEYLATVKNFKKDYNHLILVPIDNDLNALIEDLAARHPLRGFDAIHLASAITFTQSKNVEMLFACFDDTLNQSALKEGLRISFHY